MQMIHKAWALAIGNADDMLKMAEDLEKIDDSIRASYMEKFVGEEDELKELIAEETWLTAEEAKTFGLADEIWEDEDVEDDEDDEDEEEPQGSVKENLFLKYRDQNKKPESKPGNKESGLFNAFKN
jgi:ATP-dependent Clp protease, protease subunit